MSVGADYERMVKLVYGASLFLWMRDFGDSPDCVIFAI